MKDNTPVHWSDQGGASPLGHHADQLFMDCPQKYNYQVMRGLQPPPTIPLVVGGAIHAALAVYHGTAGSTYHAEMADLEERMPVRARRAMNEAFAYLNAHVESFMDDEIDEINFYTFRTLRGYVEEYRLPDPWDVLEVEQMFDVELFPGVRSTGRMDGLIDFQGQKLILEHKTTSYSCDRFYREFSNNSQVTRYCRAASILLDTRVHGILLNILQKPSNKGLGQPKFAQYIVVRTQRDIDNLQKDLINVRGYADICKRTEVWPKNTSTCYDYFRQCEFHRLCFGAGETQENLSYYQEGDRK